MIEWQMYSHIALYIRFIITFCLSKLYRLRAMYRPSVNQCPLTASVATPAAVSTSVIAAE